MAWSTLRRRTASTSAATDLLGSGGACVLSRATSRTGGTATTQLDLTVKRQLDLTAAEACGGEGAAPFHVV